MSKKWFELNYDKINIKIKTQVTCTVRTVETITSFTCTLCTVETKTTCTVRTVETKIYFTIYTELLFPL